MNKCFSAQSIPVLICGLLVSFSSGCAITKSGGGPVSREQAMKIAGHQFKPASAELRRSFSELNRDKKWSKIATRSVVPSCGGIKRGKGRRKTDMGFWDILGCGFSNRHVSFMEKPEGITNGDILCWDEALCVPGYPILWPLWFDDMDFYLQSSGQQVGKMNFFGLLLGGILYADIEQITPVSNNIPKGTIPDKYNVFDGGFVGWGLLGGGRMNNKYYGQILWVAFPVGSAN